MPLKCILVLMEVHSHEETLQPPYFKQEVVRHKRIRFDLLAQKDAMTPVNEQEVQTARKEQILEIQSVDSFGSIMQKHSEAAYVLDEDYPPTPLNGDAVCQT